MKLSIVIPCYNEKDTLEDIVSLILKSVNYEKEILLVDDCSTDGTKEIVENLVHKYPDVINAYYHKQNQGKGAALATGFKHITGDIVIIQDADLEYDPYC